MSSYRAPSIGMLGVMQLAVRRVLWGGMYVTDISHPLNSARTRAPRLWQHAIERGPGTYKELVS